MSLLKAPPHNIDAEQSVLGGLMLNPYAWDEINSQLEEEDFYKPAHRKIFRAVTDLFMKGEPVDIITVSNLLTERKEIESIGGAAYLAEIMNSTPASLNIESYSKIVREKALLRVLILLSGEIIEKSYGESYENVESFLDEVEAKIFSISEQKKQQGLTAPSDLVKVSLNKLTDLYEKKTSFTGVPSGFTELDTMTAGFQPGELTIIAARPSMGKTAFSLNIASHVALKEKKSLAFFSIEMGKEQLMMRLLASEACIDMSNLRIGQLNEKEWSRLIDRASQISQTHFYIDDTAGISPFEIRSKCRRLKAQNGLDMIMIDYLQLMDLKQRVESRERAVSEISKTLKAVAKELEVPVIALAQLNRGVEGRSDRRPMLSDLRESGSIEQDADIIMMLYREDYYDRDNPDVRGLSEVIVGKQRNGPTGTVKLRWQASIGRFSNLTNEFQGEAQGARNHPSHLNPVSP